MDNIIKLHKEAIRSAANLIAEDCGNVENIKLLTLIIDKSTDVLSLLSDESAKCEKKEKKSKKEQKKVCESDEKIGEEDHENEDIRLRVNIESRRDHLNKQQELVKKSQQRFQQFISQGMSQEEASNLNNELYKKDVQELEKQMNPGIQYKSAQQLLLWSDHIEDPKENPKENPKEDPKENPKEKESQKELDTWEIANESDVDNSVNLVE
jgi:hypothetical protein